MPSVTKKQPKRSASNAKKNNMKEGDLRDVAARIDALKNSPTHMKSLFEELKAAKKLKLKKSNSSSSITMMGVTGSASERLDVALQNWANAARRELLKAGGV